MGAGESVQSPSSASSASSPKFSDFQPKRRESKRRPRSPRRSSVGVTPAERAVVRTAVREQRERERRAKRAERFLKKEKPPEPEAWEEEEEEEEEEDGCERMEVSPQRRLFYVSVAIGASGLLSKRCFEVRSRPVLGCPTMQNITFVAPSLHHATTSALLVRWQPESWADVRLVRRYELQWKYARLDPSQRLEAWSVSAKEEDEGAEVHFFCDREFCSVPAAAVKLIDTRAEVELNGLPGSCGPLLFRVRCKLAASKFEAEKVGGWTRFSDVSEPMHTLPAVCAEVTPVVVRSTSHTLSLQWQPPADPRYGKIVAFRLFGRLGHPYGTAEDADVDLGIGIEEVIEEKEDGWVCLYEGTSCRFSVGSPLPHAQLNDDGDEERKHAEAVAPAALHGADSAAAAAAGEVVGLDPDSPYSLVLFASTGSWFHGVFRTSDVRGLVAKVPPYHGALTTHSVELKWRPPSTYGGGHDAASFMRVAQATGDWFGLELGGESSSGAGAESKAAGAGGGGNSGAGAGGAPAPLSPAAADRAAKTDWTKLRLLAEQSAVIQLSKEGWGQRVDDGGFAYWHNELSGESSWQLPEPATVPVERFVLLCKPSAQDPDWPDFRVLYEGEDHTFLAGGPESPLPLMSGVGYTFVIRAANEFGLGATSSPLSIVTLAEPPSSSSLDVPPGWVECWDASSGNCYYYNEETGENSWTHPTALVEGISYVADPGLPFRKKRFKLLGRLLERHPPPQGYAALRLVVGRKSILEDSFAQLSRLPSKSLRLKTNITFEGEDGIDSGGITNEWFMQLSRKFFEPGKGLFRRHDVSGLCSPDPIALEALEDGLQLFRFLGVVVGMAMQSKHLVDMPFCTSFYRYLLGEPTRFDDLKEVDPIYHSSLSWIANNDITDIIFETFSATVGGEEGQGQGEPRVVDIVPGGRDIDVTEANKKDYVERMAEWRLVGSIRLHLEAMIDGISQLVPPSELSAVGFVAEDIKLLLNGSPDIPVRKLRRSARYANGYDARSKPVELLWELLGEITDRQRSDVLNFVTGCPKLPLDELSLEIVRSELGPDALPSSHTCFNQLVLPEYSSQEVLREKLFIALESSPGFMMT